MVNHPCAKISQSLPQVDLEKGPGQFSQVNINPARVYEGTGLGLVLTKHLIELHDGTIAVQNVENMGVEH